jgi:hypothetical protein
LKRRGLVRFARDEHGGKVARLRESRATRRRQRRFNHLRDSMYRALTEGHFIPLIEGAS